MQTLPIALQAFKDYPQFILHLNKMPINPKTLRPFSEGSGWQNDLNATVAFEDLPKVEGYGVGFLFRATDPFFFLDIDHCLNDGEWSPLAVELCNRFAGCAVEVSSSQKALHIFGRGTPPPHRNKNREAGLELYTHSRFVALTGYSAVGDANTDASHALSSLVAEYFVKGEGGDSEPSSWTTTPVENYTHLDDATLLEKAMNSKGIASAFGEKAAFKELWEGDAVALSRAFPDAFGDRAYDASSADAALAQHLAFWTGKNCERMKHLMQQSGLVRDKWGRDDYLYRTILGACGRQKNTYYKPPIVLETPRIAPVLVTGFQYLSADQQLIHFKGCVYVQDAHRVFVPSGAFLKPDQFNATYGGYVFQLDEQGDKTTRKAWEAFTESQVVRYPKAETSSFRPDLESGALVEVGGRLVVNSYVAHPTPKREGDPALFLELLEKMLPIERDRTILLSYLAAVVQHKGVKFKWTPLIQGVEGNGKSTLTDCLAFAIGDRYTFRPMVEDLSEKFNGWLFESILVSIEDVYVQGHKVEVLEKLKPMITGSKLRKRVMNQDPSNATTCANFILNSNHKDAIPIHENGRRFAVFYTAQQSKEDKVECGMTDAFFTRLYRWLEREGGFEIVNHYLHTYQILDEFNPALGGVAPITSSTQEAILASRGGIEQEIVEAIGEGRIGFAGGWVSSVHLDLLISTLRMGRAIPHSKRTELMWRLGYLPHPALKDGRAHNPIMVDMGKKSKLYIRSDHPDLSLHRVADVVKSYENSQNTIDVVA